LDTLHQAGDSVTVAVLNGTKETIGKLDETAAQNRAEHAEITNCLQAMTKAFKRVLPQEVLRKLVKDAVGVAMADIERVKAANVVADAAEIKKLKAETVCADRVEAVEFVEHKGD
jgi:hypothetical protein